jgi:hypothetical protein
VQQGVAPETIGLGEEHAMQRLFVGGVDASGETFGVLHGFLFRCPARSL